MGNAANGTNEDLKYVNRLKSIDILPDIEQKTDVWSKYGMRYKIAMDLNYNDMVAENDKFKEEMVSELASILNVHSSLINIECAVKGSVIVTFGVCAIGFVLALFGYWSVQKLSYLIEKKIQRKGSFGEMLKGLTVGDEVLVDYNDKVYDAKVIQKFQTEMDAWVKIEYLDKPFMFQNTEKLVLSSPRLHIKEPGYQYQASLYPDEGGSISFEVIPISNL